LEAAGIPERVGPSGAAQKVLEIAVGDGNAARKGPRLAFHRTILLHQIQPTRGRKVVPV
jgi:hypothetical protein